MTSFRPYEAVLVVEDEWLIADAVAGSVRDAGYAVLGPAATVAEALALIGGGRRVDAAVLDVTLGEEKSFPVADLLSERRTPFLFVTGYRAAELPARFHAVPILGKPTLPAHLTDAIRALVGS